MNDNYSHMDSKIMYIDENIPGPYEKSTEFEELIDAYNSQLCGHCSCVETCMSPACNCLAKTCNYTMLIQNGQHQYKINTISKSPIIECNNHCSCSKECGNRLVQNGPIEGLVIKTCCISEKGLGLFTSKFIPSGTFICEYAGELLTKSQAVCRNNYNVNNGGMNYIICLNEICNDVLQQTFVDPTNFGNIGRYINHSCDPNCQVVPVRCHMPIPKLAIFSVKDILPNMEITFDYGSNDVGNSICSDNENVKRTECLCKSVNCKKFLPNNEY